MLALPCFHVKTVLKDACKYIKSFPKINFPWKPLHDCNSIVQSLNNLLLSVYDTSSGELVTAKLT